MSDKRAPLIDVDANLYRAAASCASTEAVRKYINCVRIEKHPDGGALLIATDGHRLLVIRESQAWCVRSINILLPKDGLAACQPPRAVCDHRLRVYEHGDASVGDHYKTTKSVFVSGDFVDWRKVVPVRAWRDACYPAFSARYLADIGKVARIIDREHAAARILTGPAETDPALVTFPGFDDAFLVLMPKYCGRVSAGLGLPRWMKPVMDARKRSRKKGSKAP